MFVVFMGIMLICGLLFGGMLALAQSLAPRGGRRTAAVLVALSYGPWAPLLFLATTLTWRPEAGTDETKIWASACLVMFPSIIALACAYVVTRAWWVVAGMAVGTAAAAIVLPHNENWTWSIVIWQGAALSSVGAWTGLQVRRRPKEPACSTCGYSLLGLDSTSNCPECGGALCDPRRSPQASRRRSRKARPWLVTTALLTLLVLLGALLYPATQSGRTTAQAPSLPAGHRLLTDGEVIVLVDGSGRSVFPVGIAELATDGNRVAAHVVSNGLHFYFLWTPAWRELRTFQSLAELEAAWNQEGGDLKWLPIGSWRIERL